jgi:hypothetical protein
VEPMLEVVGHVVAAEGEHGHWFAKMTRLSSHSGVTLQHPRHKL